MSAQVNRAMMSMLVTFVVVTAVAGCSKNTSGTDHSTGSTSPRQSARLQPAAATLVPAARRDDPEWAAVRFELARCSWDWRRPIDTYIAAQQAYASPAYARRIAATTDRATWRHEVVAERQVVTCAVSAPRRVPDAPSSSTRAFVRVTSDSQVTSTLGSFDAGAHTASWVVQRLAGRWVVTAPFDGG